MDIKPLTFGMLKQDQPVVDAFLKPGDGIDPIEYTARAAAFIKLSAPEVDVDAMTPAEITGAARDVFKATFNRPEDPAPAQMSN